MGSAEPRSFSRGNRGIAGTLIFSVFDRDALLASFQDEVDGIGKNAPKIQKFMANDPDAVKDNFTGNETGFTSVDDWDAMMSGLVNQSVNADQTAEKGRGPVVGKFKPHYADEILPFDITLTFNKMIA